MAKEKDAEEETKAELLKWEKQREKVRKRKVEN